MLNNEEGFGTAEALVAISSIFVVVLTFVPFIIDLVADLEEKESALTAARILYEHLEEDLFSGSTASHLYERDGRLYEIVNNTETGTLCIKYQEYFGGRQSFCLSKDVRG
ncbi:hypothetical protein FZC84_04305 [Rossellomorea vietnamensis]|uniref:Type II secretion system protein n=1 Tax=Rossellomorea vietnamensis TaxID=218284 RepID=A0A5D4MIC6_9BACI|nr:MULTISPECIES: hypothetical protein [Bacillaceae]TYS00726.1 hypothetical protein FZC84_04305 [Rossellomorea vietnamensis]